MRALIIGYGNSLRGDDGAGPAAAEGLRARVPGVSVMVQPELTPELAEPLSQAGLVILIDAAADLPPGEVRRAEVSGQTASAAFTHEVSPAALLQMAKVLYGGAPRAFLYSIGGEDFALSEGLSAAVAEGVDSVVKQVEDLIRSYTTATS